MLKLLALLFAGLKFGKLFTSGGTMLLSVVVYAFVFGWRYAVGFVALLFCHEMEHFVAARRRGLPAGLPTFIPFVGAWVDLKEQPRDAETEAYVGMAGPLIGSLAALAVYYVAREQDAAWLLALAYSGFLLNLFNLIPLSPFDGGRITAVLSPRLWLLGVPMLVGLFFWQPSPLLLLMALLAWPQVVKAWRHDPQADEARAYYGVASPETRFSYALLYLGLAAFLAVMCHDVHEMLETSRRGQDLLNLDVGT